MFRAAKSMALGFACLAGLHFASPALAGSMTRDEFAFPTQGEVKIVVFRPDVSVGSLRVGGLDEPNADWTNAARANIQAAMEASAEANSSKMQFLGDFEGENADKVNEYRGLFEAVAGAAFQHAMFYDKLPTKLAPKKNPADPQEKKRYRLDWTLGPGAAQLREVTGGDYALFFFTKDSYGDAGRKMAQLLMAGLFGSYMPAGVHVGYAGLVDLKTGDLVWFNTDLAMGGDPREADGAQKRVGQLMAGFPQRSAVAPAATPAP